jgi:hypothetical protein
MKWVTAIFVVLAVAVSAFAQVPPPKKKLPDYFPLKLGTKWIYELDPGTGVKLPVTIEIAKIEDIDGKPLARLETIIGGKVTATEYLSSTPAGVFRHRSNDVEVAPPLCIVKYPFKEGDSFEAETVIGNQKIKMTIKNGKSEEVTVRRVKYQTIAVSIETSVNGVRINDTKWYAPGIGVVKADTDFGDKKIKLELVKFEPAK